MNIRLPNITATTESGKLEQIRNYLYQFAQELNFALGSIETTAKEVVQSQAAPVKVDSPQTAEESFAAIKGLIIKSADIVEAYYETISKKLEGLYVAESEFGEYKKETVNQIVATSEYVEQQVTSFQKIVSDTLNTALETSGYIRTGLLDEKTRTIGIEVGEWETNNEGAKDFRAYSRFTAERLSFYDRNQQEMAYIDNGCLYINEAHIKLRLKLGREDSYYTLDATNGLAFV